METLFIADDERSIREGLKCILDWNELGFSICGEAGNGEDALKGLVSLNPSLALLDVRMPKMSGTEVLKKAREQGYTGKCIILSGYSDFTYAQEAIQNGVSFYITKPLDEDELLSAVNKISKELSKEKEHSNQIGSIKIKAKEVLLRELIHNSFTNQIPASDLELLHLNQDSFQIVICDRFNSSLQPPYTLADLLRTANQNQHIYDVFYEDGLEILLLKGSSGKNRLMDLLEHFDEEAEEGSPLSSLFITYGSPVSSIYEIASSYEEAKALIGRRFFCPMEQHYMGYEELPDSLQDSNNALDSSKITMFSESITGYVQSYNHHQIIDSLQTVTEYIISNSSAPEEIKMFLTDLYWQIKENIIRIFPNSEIPFPSPSSSIRFMDSANYLYEIIRYLSEQCTMIMEATGNPSRDSILDDVLYYIDHNYTGNIKLETIAPLFGYNSAYLGKLFNKSVGESFKSYIDHKRIEASKKLLENKNLKVYEISEQIGYKNVDYFHKKFKRYVGLSPAEYRKNFE